MLAARLVVVQGGVVVRLEGRMRSETALPPALADVFRLGFPRGWDVWVTRAVPSSSGGRRAGGGDGGNGGDGV